MHNLFYYFKFFGIILCFTLAGCDRDPYHGFGCIAPESHPAVAHARSLSRVQLETAYSELTELGKINKPESFDKHFFGDDIPVSLSFLEAEAIRIASNGNVSVFLANCFDERVTLILSPTEAERATITLYWAEPTVENPYATGSQTLWQESYD